jgi:molybdopterin-synthase adenylyltransferase
MTWVRTKLALERLTVGETLEVLVPPGEAETNVPRSAAGEDRALVSDSSRRSFFRDAFQSAARAALRPDEEPEVPEEVVTPLLSEAEMERYSRQLVLEDWTEEAQLRLRDASVLIVGAGALGTPVALYLAGAGVGRIGLVDDDVVDISNLHRQPLHFTPDLGVPKVESAAAKLRFLNPDVVIEPYQVRLDETNAAGLVEGQDLVIDCSDSFATRYAVNRACCEAGVDLIEGGAVGWSGLVMTILPRATACYRCAFPVEPADTRSCAEAGILGPVAGVVGGLQALEALKLLSSTQPPLLDAFLSVDLVSLDFTQVSVQRDRDCPDCGG